jgi:peptidoglycan lytic transglycosylase G
MLLSILLLLMLGTGIAGVTYYRWCEGASGTQRPVTLTIPTGTSASGVISLIHDKGVIRCGGLVGRFILYRKGTPEFRAGTFHLQTNMTFDEAMKVLTTPPPKAKTVDLTIPEGFRLTQIAQRVQETVGIPERRFMRAATNGTWSLPPYLPTGTKTSEGFLFPETYRVAVKTATPARIIKELLDQFEEEARSLPWRNAARLGVTPYQAVIVASMIEKEAFRDSERPLISAVIYNRLKIGMPLGIDATLLYDDPTPGDNSLSESDLRSNSPYNTRLDGGLPPTPIASPQLASIRAALEPAHVRYLYYVLCPKDGKGVHRFSLTNTQHVNNKHECLGT